MRNKAVILILMLAAWTVTVAVGDVRGNTWRGEELERLWRKAGWKIGPFRIQLALMLSNAGYDSNVYYSQNPIKDYGFTAGPAFNIYMLIKRKILFKVYESAQYVYFKETTKERTWNNYSKWEVHFLHNKLLFSAGGGSSDAREKWNTEIDIRPRRKEDSLEGSFLWQASSKTSFWLKYQKVKIDYESLEYQRFNVNERLNREENSLNFVVSYQLSHRTKLFIDGEYGIFNFDNPLSRRGSRSHGVYGGFEFSPLGKIRGKIRLGYKSFDSLTPEMPDYQGIVGEANVQLRLLWSMSARATYKRDVQFSVWYDNTYFLEETVGGGVSLYTFRRKVRLDYDYRVGRNSYPVSSRQEALRREDNYYLHSIGLYYRLKKNIGIGVIAGRWKREINIFMEKSNRDFAAVNLTYDF